jgi:hypothetical protein
MEDFKMNKEAEVFAEIISKYYPSQKIEIEISRILTSWESIEHGELEAHAKPYNFFLIGLWDLIKSGVARKKYRPYIDKIEETIFIDNLTWFFPSDESLIYENQEVDPLEGLDIFENLKNYNKKNVCDYVSYVEGEEWECEGVIEIILDKNDTRELIKFYEDMEKLSGG